MAKIKKHAYNRVFMERAFDKEGNPVYEKDGYPKMRQTIRSVAHNAFYVPISKRK
jgi:hypothetical protein